MSLLAMSDVSTAHRNQTSQTSTKLPSRWEHYSLPPVVEMARTSAIAEAQAIVTASSILSAVGVGILTLLPPTSTHPWAIATTIFGYSGVSLNIMAAFSSAQIIAQLLYLPDEARLLCKLQPDGRPAKAFSSGEPVGDRLIFHPSRFPLLREFGLCLSKGRIAWFLASLTLSFSYQLGYCCLVLQLLCMVWARELKVIGAVSTPVILISIMPLLQNVISNTIVGYRAAVAQAKINTLRSRASA